MLYDFFFWGGEVRHRKSLWVSDFNQCWGEDDYLIVPLFFFSSFALLESEKTVTESNDGGDYCWGCSVCSVLCSCVTWAPKWWRLVKITVSDAFLVALNVCFTPSDDDWMEVFIPPASFTSFHLSSFLLIYFVCCRIHYCLTSSCTSQSPVIHPETSD